MRLFLAILVGKFIASISRTFRIGGGSAAPGLYALKIEPDLVRMLAEKIPSNVIITGTNGKTTTARILAHLAKEAGLEVIRNSTGSNLERGIASTLIQGVNLYHLQGDLRRHLGIWELDEAAFNTVAPKLRPDIVVFLNIFRDQLDRYGEVDTVVKRWCKTLETLSSDTIVLVNGDDANTLKLKSCFKGKVETFGVEDYKIVGESLENIEHPHKLDFEAKNVKLNGLEGSEFTLSLLHTTSYILQIPIPGIYHIYDAVAALAAAYHLNLAIHRLTDSLTHFQPAFGRVEKLSFGYIFLIKNPAGATQVFETIAPQIRPQDKLLIALNDNLADGTDVSWIWDAKFEGLLTHKTVKKSAGGNTVPPQGWTTQGWTTIVSGSRAYDLAVRFKYAGFEPEKLEVELSLEKALRKARTGPRGQLFILPTYTALLKLQKLLTMQGIKGHYWKES